MSITQEEAEKVIQLTKVSMNDLVDIYLFITEHIQISQLHRDGKFKPYLILVDYYTDKHVERVTISSASIIDSKLHIVLETEEELIIPIKD